MCFFFKIRTSGSGGDIFIDISYFELWQPFYSAEQNLLCNFVRGHYTIQYKYHMSIKNTKCISSKSCKYRVSIGTR